MGASAFKNEHPEDRNGTSGEAAVELSPEEFRALFDDAARRYLRMSGQEFLRRWKAGEFEDCDSPEVVRVAMLLPAVEESVT